MEDIIKKTQAELGAIIQAPKLTDKLLSRPPFRFLHDVVVAVLKSSNFPEGLYPDDQLDSANVADKKAKLEFLERLIAVVEAGTGRPVSARAAKIAAGEEAEKTNELLQGFAACAALPTEKKQAAVRKVKGGAEPPAAAAAAPAAPATKAPKPSSDAPAQESEEERQRRHEAKKRQKEKERAEKAAAAAAAAEAAAAAAADTAPADAETASKQPDADTERRRRRQEKKRESNAVSAASADNASTDAAPSATTATATAAAAVATASARKAPPRTKPTHEVIEAQRGADATPAAGVIREGKRGSAADKGSDDDDAQDWQKVAAQYDAKPAARTAAVAEGAEVRGMLGQQALKAKREQEEAAQRGEDVGGAAASSAAPANGGIVIRNSRNTVSRGGGGHALGDGDLNQLREQLQMLTKASNPLGKFLEAIHDDLDSMTRELEMWRSESRSQALAATEARRQTEESLQEIHANLQNLEDAISDQMLKTNNLRQTILSNDAAMETMMKTIVNPDIAAQ